MSDVDFHTGIYGIISFIQQLPGYCFVYVGFTTVLTHVRWHVFEYQSDAIPLQGNCGCSGIKFAMFANNALHYCDLLSLNR